MRDGFLSQHEKPAFHRVAHRWVQPGADTQPRTRTSVVSHSTTAEQHAGTFEPQHARFGLPWRMERDEEIPEERVREIARRFEGFGLKVQVGG